jgi:hypothetical protein
VTEDFEQTILSALHDLPHISREGVTVETPKLYHFFPGSNTQIYSDLPSSLDLKTYVLKHPLEEPQCSRVGQALGLWTKRFHSWAAAPEQEKLRESMKGNTSMLELKYQLNYGTNLIGSIDNYPGLLEDSRETFKAVGKRAREDLDTGRGRLIHGDFWSGK